MNTETLNTFVVLSELKNYTLTANRLFVAQSTVTNRIIELEHELGNKLFIRNRKQLQLTEEGALFLPYAKRFLELKDSAMNEMSNLKHYEASLRIGSTNTIYDCHLERKLIEYIQNNTNIKLDIKIGHSIPLIQMLQDKIIDIAFTYVPYNKNHIHCNTITSDNLLLVTSSQNNVYQDGIVQKDLAKLPYYYCDFTFQNLGSYIKELFPAGTTFGLEIDRSSNLLPFLLTGKGYSFLPESIVRKELLDGKLISIPLLGFTVPPIDCYMLVADTGIHNEAITSLSEMFFS